MEDGANPVYEKEIRSEIFSQGTLMLRIVIQVSILLALPLMACWLYIFQQYTPWYVAYVLLFNMLVGPVFSAGSITGERERQTLDLLLTTMITPWQIIVGKLVAGLRISSVLTLFLVWPLILAALMIHSNWANWASFLTYLGIVLMTCVTTALMALFCSLLFRKTSQSLLASYFILLVLFTGPLAVSFLATRFHATAPVAQAAMQMGFVSPIQTALQVPLQFDEFRSDPRESSVPRERAGSWQFVRRHALFTVVLNSLLFGVMFWLFHRRWRIA
jgi:ABC-type transport system involved in multi-copper enzyme maturation permease subunit